MLKYLVYVIFYYNLIVNWMLFDIYDSSFWLSVFIKYFISNLFDTRNKKKRKKDRRFSCSLKGRKEMLYLTMHSIHFIYGYMASDIW